MMTMSSLEGKFISLNDASWSNLEFWRVILSYTNNADDAVAMEEASTLLNDFLEKNVTQTRCVSIFTEACQMLAENNGCKFVDSLIDCAGQSAEHSNIVV